MVNNDVSATVDYGVRYFTVQAVKSESYNVISFILYSLKNVICTEGFGYQDFCQHWVIY